MPIYCCYNIGLSGTTDVHVKEIEDGLYEARMGFALMGSTNMDEAGFKACNYDPFHDKFYDNYATGKGPTEQDAIEALKRDVTGVANSLWD